MGMVAFRVFAAVICMAGFAVPAAAGKDDCPEDRRVHLAGCVDLDTVMAADLQLSGAWIGAMQPGQATARAYLTILNRGKTSDRFLGATSLAAGRIELWEDRQVEGGVAIEPGDAVAFTPGGLHLAMSDVDGRFRAGSEVEVTLDFENAGSVVVSFPVRDPAPTASASH